MWRAEVSVKFGVGANWSVSGSTISGLSLWGVGVASSVVAQRLSAPSLASLSVGLCDSCRAAFSCGPAFCPPTQTNPHATSGPPRCHPPSLLLVPSPAWPLFHCSSSPPSVPPKGGFLAYRCRSLCCSVLCHPLPSSLTWRGAFPSAGEGQRIPICISRSKFIT